jgi:PhzF family phenazine biosynthesis protein
MSVPMFVVDAFTDKVFAGNPAGVCLLKEDKDKAWMQQVAREMQHAETAFLSLRPDHIALRWFTPTVEVDLCGHATLAAAHVLWETDRLPRGGKITFRTRSGVLTATQDGDWIKLDFPALTAEWADIPPGLSDALGAKIVSAARSKFDLLCELESEAAVRDLAPDLALVAMQPFRGVIVTAAAANDEHYDFVSRFFAPQSGVPEDPVTGSAHCALGPFWGERLGQTKLVGYQASPRGGTVKLELAGERIMLIGQAVTSLRGELIA